MTTGSARTREPLRKLIEDVEVAFAGAMATGFEEQCYELLGAVVQVRYAGPAVRRLFHPALAHRAVDPAPPELVVQTWTSDLGQFDSVSLPTEARNPSQGWFAENGPYRAYGRGAVVHALDSDRSVGWLWAPTASDFGLSEIAGPFRPLLEWWGRSRGIERVHAGAVATQAGGVLLAGVGGSGKSTTALAAARAGLDFAGDDAVFVSADSRPRVYSAYDTVKLEDDHLQRLPWMAGSSDRAGGPDEKALAHVRNVLPGRCTDGFPLRAIACLRVSGHRETSVERLSGARALARLAPSSVVIQAGDRRATVARLADLVRRVPCYSVEAGLDNDLLVAAVAELTRFPPEGGPNP